MSNPFANATQTVPSQQPAQAPAQPVTQTAPAAESFAVGAPATAAASTPTSELFGSPDVGSGGVFFKHLEGRVVLFRYLESKPNHQPNPKYPPRDAVVVDAWPIDHPDTNYLVGDNAATAASLRTGEVLSNMTIQQTHPVNVTSTNHRNGNPFVVARVQRNYERENKPYILTSEGVTDEHKARAKYIVDGLRGKNLA